MTITSPVLLTGMFIGLVLTLVGVLLGASLSRRTRRSESKSLDDFHLTRLLQHMFQRTDGIASDVSSHRKLVDSLTRQVRDAEQHLPAGDPEFIVRLLSRVVQANEMLQQRLDHAERTLKEQAAEITSYISQARTDTLTGLPNRREFNDEMARRLAEFRRHGNSLSVLIVDIDHFKRFNDRHGHLAGDAVLIEVARVLRETMRESDLVTRLGGEEFAIVLPGADGAAASEAAERVRSAVEAAVFHYEGKRMQVTVSCGVAKLNPGEDAKSVVKRADQALYASKTAGRNFAHWHDGRQSVPITAAIDPPYSAANRSDLDSPEGYTRVCDELRQRLMAIVSQEVAG